MAEHKIKPFLKNLAILGLAGAVLTGKPEPVVHAHKETAPQTQLSDYPDGPFTNKYGTHSSNPRLSLKLKCNLPHAYDEYNRWVKNHIDAVASFRQMKDESVYLAFESGGKVTFPLWMVSKKVGRPSFDLVTTITIAPHAYVFGFDIGGNVVDGVVPISEVWFEAGKKISAILYDSEDLDHTKRPQKIIARVDRSINCPNSSKDRSGLVREE